MLLWETGGFGPGLACAGASWSGRRGLVGDGFLVLEDFGIPSGKEEC